MAVSRAHAFRRSGWHVAELNEPGGVFGRAREPEPVLSGHTGEQRNAGSDARMDPVRTVRAAVGSLVFLVAVPGVAVGVIPWLLTRWRVREPLPQWLPLRVVGAILLAGGIVVLLQAFARFAFEGIGTPAPIAPTERLVVRGLYRHVRNPMYLAVTAMIVGQALLLGQLILLPYALAFVVAVVSFVHWYEEPTLRRQFGEEYEAYRDAVPVGGRVDDAHADSRSGAGLGLSRFTTTR